MATQWEGKSRGTVFGYRIFVFFIKKIGLKTSYFLLWFVALYFCIFSWKRARAIFYYFRSRRKFSFIKSIVSVYKNHYVFGQTIIDKVAIASGMLDKFTYDFDGAENITNLLKVGKGGILISAHVGNFEIAEFFFEKLETSSQIHLVTTDAEHAEIKNYLEQVTSKSTIKFIIVNDDLSHIFHINNALTNGDLVCFTGDRFFKDQKTLTAAMFNKEADFPAGPFLLASRMKVPVLFVYVMKEKAMHYHLSALTSQVVKRDAEALLKDYIRTVESVLSKYPLQWFNYFDFWKLKK